jgi:hypothetical protein
MVVKKGLGRQIRNKGLINKPSSFIDLVLIVSPAIFSVSNVSDCVTEVEEVLAVKYRNLTSHNC